MTGELHGQALLGISRGLGQTSPALQSMSIALHLINKCGHAPRQPQVTQMRTAEAYQGICHRAEEKAQPFICRGPSGLLARPRPSPAFRWDPSRSAHSCPARTRLGISRMNMSCSALWLHYKEGLHAVDSRLEQTGSVEPGVAGSTSAGGLPGGCSARRHSRSARDMSGWSTPRFCKHPSLSPSAVPPAWLADEGWLSCCKSKVAPAPKTRPKCLLAASTYAALHTSEQSENTATAHWKTLESSRAGVSLKGSNNQGQLQISRAPYDVDIQLT